MRDLANILSIFQGSGTRATIALYEDLQPLGAPGAVAIELLRVQKASTRAKVYRRGFKAKAYDKKEWAMINLAGALAEYGEMQWGWKQDLAQEFHNWVLYVDLPNGQISFHAAARGTGPDYPGEWDGIKNMSPTRICRFVADLFADSAGQTPTARSEQEGRGQDLTLQGATALTHSEGE